MKDEVFKCATCAEIEYRDECGGWNRILDPICRDCFTQLTETEQEDRY